MLFWALVCWALALCLYGLMTALILWRAVHDPAVPEGFEPDNWILMGGLAIATLAGDHIHHALIPGPFADAVRTVTIVTWVIATLWIPPLVYLGLRRITQRAGALRFEGVWWAAVFPLGMYSVATFTTAREIGWHALTTVSSVFFWIAFPAWAIVAFGAAAWLTTGRTRR